MPLTRPTDPIVALTRVAIRRARARSDQEVTPDDLLMAALGEVARFGVALIGPWAIDLTEFDPAQPTPEVKLPDVAPRYSESTVAVFESAARIAGVDGSPTVGIIHMLVALGSAPEDLFRTMSKEYGIELRAWRTALARGQVGPATDSPTHQEAEPGAASVGAGASARASAHLLSVDDAASLLGVHSQTVRNYIRGGKLPAYRLAGERSIRVLRRDLMALLEPVDSEEDESDDLELPISLSIKEN